MAKPTKTKAKNKVPRYADINGQPHLLAYIRPDEAQLLKDNGGMGTPGPGGIPQYGFWSDTWSEIKSGGKAVTETYNSGSSGGGRNLDADMFAGSTYTASSTPSTKKTSTKKDSGSGSSPTSVTAADLTSGNVTTYQAIEGPGSVTVAKATPLAEVPTVNVGVTPTDGGAGTVTQANEDVYQAEPEIVYNTPTFTSSRSSTPSYAEEVEVEEVPVSEMEDILSMPTVDSGPTYYPYNGVPGTATTTGGPGTGYVNPQVVTQQVTPPDYYDTPTEVTPSIINEKSGTFSSPLQTAGLSAIPSQVSYKTHYAGTQGLVDPSLYAPLGMQQVVYMNNLKQQVVVTEKDGVPTTYVPPGFIRQGTQEEIMQRQANTAQAALSTQPAAMAQGGTVRGYAEGGQPQDPMLEAKFRIANMNGYNGPKTNASLNAFANASPAMIAKFNAIGAAMAKGGYVNKYAAGGTVSDPAFTQQQAERTASLIEQTMQPIQAPVQYIQPAAEDFVPVDAGQVTPVAPYAEAATVDTVQQAVQPTQTPAATVEATTVTPQVKAETDDLQAAQGTVSEGAQITAQQFDPEALSQLGLDAAQIDQAQQIADIPDLALTPEQLAQAATLASTGMTLPQAVAQTTGEEFSAVAAKFEGKTPEAVAMDEYSLTPTQAATTQNTAVQAAAKASEIPTAEAAQSTFVSDVQAVQGRVGANELANAADIIGATKAVTAIAATMDALNEAAVASAAQGTFSQTALAKAAQGSVSVEATVQGQMSSLMKQFDNGTPAWAAGAMRAANAAMASRGLGGSSMAAAAIVQATMEAATPIAAQDAQVFAQMGMQNLSNRQQVSLANAAAQQNMELQNLNNRQQAALQNSSNAFALQNQSLNNTQQVVLANAQFKAGLQEQTLNIRTQTALTNAARYAEMNNINLSNEQQTRLVNSSQNLQVDLTNLSNSQQTALSNLQVRAALVGQELSNEQQVSVLTSTQAFEAARLDATNQQQAFMQDASAQAALEGKAMDIRQQTALFNVSSQLREREVELTNEQQTRLFNTTNAMDIEVQNLSNRQQTALANAQIDAAIKGQELSNTQQANVINAARISEIANINFTAEQQKAVENAKLAQTVDIENLNASQSKILADAAAMSQIDTTNLNNRQQAEVQNAQNFLQMDLTNLSNEQQTALFKSQQNIQSLFTDQAAENAAKQFNASSENQTNQFFSNLQAQTSQFNASQQNAMDQFNVNSVNALRQFNSELQQQRDTFNAKNGLVIAQANALWRQTVTGTNTAAQNESNMNFAKTMNALTGTNLDAYWQKEKDVMSFAYASAENAADRIAAVALQELTAEQKADYADQAGKGTLTAILLKGALDYALGS